MQPPDLPTPPPPKPGRDPGPGRFKLVRYFSITCFVAIVVTAGALGYFHREIAVDSLIEQGESNSAALTRVLANSLAPVLGPYMAKAEALRTEELASHPDKAALTAALARELRGLNVAKVKVYDLEGRTVFSTEHPQIGEDKSGNAGFQRARRGSLASELTHRDKFSTFDRVIENRDLLSTYLPVRLGADTAISAVVEVYDDVTPLLARIEQAQLRLGLAALLALSALFGALFVLVRHADRVLRRQYHDRERAEEALRQAQETLERRVKARTDELARANTELEAEISERRLADQRVAHMAHHDALTGLPNRTLLVDRVGQAIARAQRGQGRLALLFLDLDRFKNVNDSFGHAVGDQLLTGIAGRLSASRRAEDTVARLGGDEFVVAVPDISTPADAETVAARILADLAKPFVISGHELHADFSIGIAVYPDDGDTAETLMRNADTAMYHAKEAGRGNYQFFTTKMSERVSRRVSTENRLRRALERGEFDVHYQPLVELATGRFAGAEALLRWPQADQGMMSPAEFIPIAEDTGLIVPLGEWVLLQSCAQAQVWQAEHPGLRVAVNLSARQFRQKDLTAMIEQVLRETGLAPNLLELELTEGMLMHNVEEAAAILDRLHEMGVRLAIDDFGTGYSSLSYLKSFPIHTVKIDRTFVRDISTDPDDAAIVTAIVAMAHSLNLKVTAEGVQAEDQAAFLRFLECDLAQGFHFGRPMPAAQLATRLAAGAKPPLRVAA